MDIAEIVAAVGTDERPARTEELARSVHQRGDRVPELRDLALSAYRRSMLSTCRSLGEDLVLDFVGISPGW